MSSSVSSGRSAASASASSDDPFALIERGNAMESSGNLWSAADAFGRASVLLRSEASDVAEEISQIEAATSSTAESESMKRKSVTERAAIRSRKLTEKRKIAALYLEQSRSYLGRARRCLLNALQFETQEDERRSKALRDSNVGPMGRRLRVLMEQAEPLVGMLPPNEARRRRRIFARIYAGGEEEQVAEAAAAERKAAAKEAEEKKDDEAEAKAKEGKDAADADAEAEAEADAEMEAALLEEMDAEFGSSIPAAPGSASAEAKPKFDSKGKDEDNEVGIDIPAAPSLPTLPKKADTDMLFIPHAPEDGAGHIERRGKPAATPPQPPSAAAAAAAGFPLPPEAPTCSAGSSGDVTSSLEARMAQLNATLPPGIKSHDERMEDIQRGLGRLGLSLPDHKNSIAKVFQHHTDKTEEEQIRDIMDMAADEARIEGAEEGQVSKALAAANAAGGGAKGAEAEGDELVINDADDLNAVLARAGLTTAELKSEVAKIEEVLGEDGKKALRDLNDGGQAVADRAKALSLIGAAQELLFEASAHLEDEIEEVDEEEEEIMAAGEQDNGDEDARDRKDREDKSGKKKESDALRRGRAGLVGAVRCLERAIAALPR